MYYYKLASDDVYRFCIDNNLFTRGTRRQYDIMFQMTKGKLSKADLHDIAIVLWICSSPDDSIIFYSVEKFEKEVKALAHKIKEEDEEN